MVQFYSIDSDDEETNQQHADHPDGMALAVDRDHHSTGIRMTPKPAGLFLAKICPRDKNGARTKSNAKKCNLNCPYENLSLAHFIFVLGTLFKVLGSIGKNFDRTLA